MISNVICNRHFCSDFFILRIDMCVHSNLGGGNWSHTDLAFHWCFDFFKQFSQLAPDAERSVGLYLGSGASRTVSWPPIWIDGWETTYKNDDFWAGLWHRFTYIMGHSIVVITSGRGFFWVIGFLGWEDMWELMVCIGTWWARMPPGGWKVPASAKEDKAVTTGHMTV